MYRFISLLLVLTMATMASAAATLEWIGPNGTASPWETAANWENLATGGNAVPTNVDTARLYNALGLGFTDSNVTINTTTAICQKLQMKYLTCKLTVPAGMKLTTTGSVEMQIGTSSQLDIQAGATMDACTKANIATATFKLCNDAAAASTDTVNVWGTLNVISLTPANGTSELDICNVTGGSGTGTVNINSTGVVNVDAYNIGTAGTGRIVITIGGTMTVNGDVTAQVNADIAAGKIAGASGATASCTVSGGKTIITASTGGGPTPPAPPASITYPGSSASGSYTVTWAASTGATSYQLERERLDAGCGSIWTQVFSGSSISYSESVTFGSYLYRVKATNSTGSSAYTTGSSPCMVFIPPPASVSFSAGAITGWDFQEIEGDIARNNIVDLNDLSALALNWLASGCDGTNNWCAGSDLNGSTGVDLIDYALLAGNWNKQAGKNVLLQTIYGTAQDSTGNIVPPNTTRALQSTKGMAMAFAVPQATALDKGIFKLTASTGGKTVEVRLYNVTGKGYLTYNHGSVSRADPGTGGDKLIDVTVNLPSPVPSHSEGTQTVSNMVVNFGPLEVTAGEYLLVFDCVYSGTGLTTACAMVKGLAGTVASNMCKYPDGTPLPKRAIVTTSAGTGNNYYYYLGSSTDVNYSHASDQFACQITTTAVNHPPQANAGMDQTVQAPNVAYLSGTASDDGNPNPPGVLTTTWSKCSGPGTVVFGDEHALSTTAAFSDVGTYVLMLTASDGVLSSTSLVTIIYINNAAPVVNAGPDKSVGILDATTIAGTVTDDGLPNPPAAVTTTWTQTSGPGTATFGNANAVNTSVSFSDIGIYVLRLTANDGDLENFDEVTINVVDGSLNESPVVNAGPDQTIFIGSSISLNGTATDDGKPNPPATVTTMWTQESGPGTVTFGDVTALNTTADFPAAGTYVLRLTASDSQIESHDELTVTVKQFTYEGYEPVTTGGDGGTVVWVTNTSSSGSGSFTDAVTGLTGAPTIIKFAVGGTISFGGEIRIDQSNVTVAGETAPAPGITFTGGGRLGIKANNVIIRHIRSRNAGAEGIQIWDGSGIIIDHCSISGTGDGAIDINPSTHVIVSRCLIAECVEVHKAHGQHVSVHHNYYTYNNRRQPRVYIGGPIWDFRNNVVEYWTGSGGNILDSNGVNIVNNIYGPPAPAQSWDLALVITGSSDPNTIYTHGNYCLGKNIDAMGLATIPNEEPNVITTDILADPNAFRDSIRRDCGALPRDSIDTGYAGPAGP